MGRCPSSVKARAISSGRLLSVDRGSLRTATVDVLVIGWFYVSFSFRGVDAGANLVKEVEKEHFDRAPDGATQFERVFQGGDLSTFFPMCDVGRFRVPDQGGDVPQAEVPLVAVPPELVRWNWLVLARHSVCFGVCLNISFCFFSIRRA